MYVLVHLKYGVDAMLVSRHSLSRLHGGVGGALAGRLLANLVSERLQRLQDSQGQRRPRTLCVVCMCVCMSHAPASCTANANANGNVDVDVDVDVNVIA